jgi:hypothetical protein
MHGNLETLLRAHYFELAGEEDARASFRRQELRVHSQNGEDGLLLHVFSKVGATNRRLVEFGIGDGRQCNAANLILNFGWSGLLMDCDATHVMRARNFYHDERGIPPQRLRIEECLVTRDNIDAVLERYGTKAEIDLLSIDIDGNDYWVWKAMQVVEPRVVAIEYNASFGASDPLVAVYDPRFDRKAKHPSGWYHGASLPALARLGSRRGYALVGCDSSGVNAFFVRRDLAQGRLMELAPAEAFYPNRRRLRRASEREQLARLRGLEFARDESEA